MEQHGGERYFEALWSWSQTTTGATPHSSRDYCIAGESIRIVFGDRAIEGAISAAIGHLSGRGMAHPLIVNALDAASHGTRPPIPDWTSNPLLQHSRISSLCTPHVTILYEEHIRTLSAVDVATGRAVFVALDAAGLPLWERAAPLRGLLAAWLARRGIAVAHAAALATEKGALLLTGKGGSGKSTTALLGALAGLEYLGDDWCALSAGENDARVFNLYNSAKLHWDSVCLIPELESKAHNQQGASEEKATYFLNSVGAVRIKMQAPLLAVLLPRVADSPCSAIRPATAADCWRALGPNSIAYVPGAGAAQFQLLGAVARTLPAFHLDLGRDTKAIPDLLKKFLNSQGHPA